jgi:hypothetical protein
MWNATCSEIHVEKLLPVLQVSILVEFISFHVYIHMDLCIIPEDVAMP